MNLRKLVQTISYVTSIPIGTNISTDNDSYKGLAKYLPWTGLLIALMLAGLAYILKLVTGTSVLIGTILAILWLCITGGIHMDGLMDTADGVFSHQPKEKMLEIMQDPRVGNFGVLTGIVVFMAKLAALVSVSSNLKALIPLLIIVPIASRWCELFAIGKFNYAKEAGTGKIWHDTTRFPTDLFFGMVPLAIACATLMFLASVKLVLAATFLTVAAGMFASYRLNAILQGHTGDSYGAVVEIAEALGLLVCAVLVRYLV